jgi:hypothetical protein
VNETINLKEIEKKAWRSYFQDGLWDLFLGLLLLSFGIIPFLEGIGIPHLLSYIAFIPAYVVFFAGKKYITVPRMGFVKFGSKRKSKKMKARIVLAISVIFGFVVFLLALTNTLPVKGTLHFGALAFGINAIIVFSLLAYFLDFTRLYLYGLFFAVSIAFVELSRSYVGSTYNAFVGFGTFGGITTIIGIAYLIRFLQKYPLPPEKTSNQESRIKNKRWLTAPTLE